jgi:hypothetical protein
MLQEEKPLVVAQLSMPVGHGSPNERSCVVYLFADTVKVDGLEEMREITTIGEK